MKRSKMIPPPLLQDKVLGEYFTHDDGEKKKIVLQQWCQRSHYEKRLVLGIYVDSSVDCENFNRNRNVPKAIFEEERKGERSTASKNT